MRQSVRRKIGTAYRTELIRPQTAGVAIAGSEKLTDIYSITLSFAQLEQI